MVVAGEHRAALAHGDVVRGVEAQRADVAEGAAQFAVVGGAQRIAAVLDEPEIVFLCQRGDGIQIVGVAQRVREHDGLGPGRDRGFDLGRVDVVAAELHIDEHRHGAEL